MDSRNEALGQQIRASRERLGLSQRQLAELVGIPAHQTISQIEKGTRGVKVWELATLAKILRIDISTFVLERNQMEGSRERSEESRLLLEVLDHLRLINDKLTEKKECGRTWK